MSKSFLTFLRTGFFALLTLAAVGSVAPLAFAAQAPVAKTPVVVGVNINTASAAELADALNGVGMQKAEAIVAYRTANGAFTSVEQLLEVKGIGEATLSKNRTLITL